MKRIFSLLLAILLCALPLVGCGLAEEGGVKPPNEGGNEPSAEENGDEPSVEEDGGDQVEIDRIGGVSLAAFSAVLDAENMTPGIGQGDFIKQMGKYKYPAEIQAELDAGPASIGGVHRDGFDQNTNCFTYGYHHNGLYFGYENDGRWALGSEESHRTNSFYARVVMNGLTMPYSVDFDDTLNDVFCKIGIDEARYADILSDFEKLEQTESLTLYQKDHVSLQLHKGVITVAKDGEKSREDGYLLIYSETSPFTSQGGEVGTATRSVHLRFLAGGALSEIYFSVQEDYV
ncbi:MAG: hypothetical protein IJY16_04775 [Clostridia bacterium]|nr:hypothetical protein [Clostridia bacterium]